MSFAEWFDANQIAILRWAHIVAMAYWLGGEWGVFNASREVVNANLTLAERRRHMETAYRIDILPRTGIIALLPLGLHMGYLYGFIDGLNPADPATHWMPVALWAFFGCWFALTWTAFFRRGTDLGIALTKADEAIRYVVIPALFAASIASLIWEHPFTQQWYAVKAGLYAFALIIGLLLRYIMRDWVTLFRRIAAEGSTPAVEGRLTAALARGRKLAYLYWVVIISVAFFGAVKPVLWT
jgi:hypothetical protein